ncbi:MAG: hypothetical protein RMK67_02555 [Chloroflexota bacterium]|nr:hypothetical protein [Chloroflexota bacterium]
MVESPSDLTHRYTRERAQVEAALRHFREGIHFRRNEEGKPTLMDAGAALLRDALGLYPDGDRLVELRETDDGHVRAVITVVLYDRETGRPRASGIGSASSRELMTPGRRLAGDLDPGNVACKLARKRAEVDAMLGIPAVCEAFAQDLGLSFQVDPETGEVQDVALPAAPEGAPDVIEAGAGAASPATPQPRQPPAMQRPPSAPSRPAACSSRPSPEEMAAQRRALEFARRADPRDPYGHIARILGLQVEGSAAVTIMRWLDQGHSWQEVWARLAEASPQATR